jgi:hypothetical protein
MQAHDWVEAFIDALHRLEERGEPEPLLQQFAPDARLRTLTHEEPLEGREQIAGFWQQYRSQFQRIESRFERTIVSEEQAALEWEAEGTLSQGGRGISYRGVTLLRRGENGLSEFASYYDPQPFLAALGVRAQEKAA